MLGTLIFFAKEKNYFFFLAAFFLGAAFFFGAAFFLAAFFAVAIFFEFNWLVNQFTVVKIKFSLEHPKKILKYSNISFMQLLLPD